MLGLVKFLFVFIISFSVTTTSFSETRKFNIGQIATKEEVAGWDIDVRPDGLTSGHGTSPRSRASGSPTAARRPNGRSSMRR